MVFYINPTNGYHDFDQRPQTYSSVAVWRRIGLDITSHYTCKWQRSHGSSRFQPPLGHTTYCRSSKNPSNIERPSGVGKRLLTPLSVPRRNWLQPPRTTVAVDGTDPSIHFRMPTTRTAVSAYIMFAFALLFEGGLYWPGPAKPHLSYSCFWLVPRYYTGTQTGEHHHPWHDIRCHHLPDHRASGYPCPPHPSGYHPGPPTGGGHISTMAKAA